MPDEMLVVAVEERAVLVEFLGARGRQVLAVADAEVALDAVKVAELYSGLHESFDLGSVVFRYYGQQPEPSSPLPYLQVRLSHPFRPLGWCRGDPSRADVQPILRAHEEIQGGAQHLLPTSENLRPSL